MPIELQGLLDLGFQADLTGFELPEIDFMLSEAAESDPKRDDLAPEDEVPDPPAPKDAVSQRGGMWDLGRHRLVCGDARDPAVYRRLMGNERADMIFADPPYNVPIRGHVSGLGRVRHREFAMAHGEMSDAEYADFLRGIFAPAVANCRDGAIAFICTDWRHLAQMEISLKPYFSELKNTCVWVKTNAGMGTFYRSKHEFVLVYKIGDAPHINTFGLGDKGRYRTNVWTYAGVNTFKADRMAELEAHPTVKPVALVADAIRDVTDRGGIVLDPFGGSGSTLIAAQKTGRSARLIEIDPTYCDVIVRRFQKLTGKTAVRSGSTVTFEDVERDRAAGWRTS